MERTTHLSRRPFQSNTGRPPVSNSAICLKVHHHHLQPIEIDDTSLRIGESERRGRSEGEVGVRVE